MPTYEHIDYDESHDGRVAHVTLDRPDKMNALSEALLAEFDDALDRVEANETAKLVVVAGAGEAFSAGYDLAPSGDYGGDEEETLYHEFRDELGHLARMERVRTFPKPTIAAVDGWALAGGFELSQMVDIVIATEDAEFGYPIVRATGVPPTMFLPYVVGNRMARELILTGRTVGGEEAAEIDLANRCVPGADLDDAVAEMVEHVLKVPSDMLFIAKRQLNTTLDLQGYADAVARGQDLHMIGHETPSSHEFSRRVREEGLQAALRWRDGTVKD